MSDLGFKDRLKELKTSILTGWQSVKRSAKERSWFPILLITIMAGVGVYLTYYFFFCILCITPIDLMTSIKEKPPWLILPTIVAGPSILLAFIFRVIHKREELRHNRSLLAIRHNEMATNSEMREKISAEKELLKCKLRKAQKECIDDAKKEKIDIEKHDESIEDSPSPFVSSKLSIKKPEEVLLQTKYIEQIRNHLYMTSQERAYMFFEAELLRNSINLTRVDLSKVDLTFANFDRANLEGANLANSKLKNASLRQASLRRATLTLTNFSQADLIGTDFESANLKQANISNATATRANFLYADLSGAQCQNSDFSECDLIGANFKVSNYFGITLTGAMYDEETIFPDGFDPIEYGMIKFE